MTVANEASKKKVDVIDLTIESSSDEEDDPPAKRKCIFMAETQSSPTKGFVNSLFITLGTNCYWDGFVNISKSCIILEGCFHLPLFS